MIDTDKYERMTMNDMEHFELWEFSRKLFAEVKRLREDIVSILGAIDLPDYDEFPNTQKELKQMMLDYGQEHLIAVGYE